MNGSANVRSLEAIEAVKTALVLFRDQIDQSLSTIDGEMRRVLDWLEHDRPRFWRTQVRTATDEVTAARAALHRCLMYPIADERPSCHEERALLKRAEARLAYCQEKAERLQHWIREVRHETFEYDGRIAQLTELVEEDVPKAMAILDRLLTRLHEYQSVRQAGGKAPSSAASTLAHELWPEPQANVRSAAVPEQANGFSAATPDAPVKSESDTT